jgi:hypothetical protein
MATFCHPKERVTSPSMFSFPSLAAYEQYRKDAAINPEVQKAVAFAKETRCFTRYERSFFRPLLPKTA